MSLDILFCGRRGRARGREGGRYGGKQGGSSRLSSRRGRRNGVGWQDGETHTQATEESREERIANKFRDERLVYRGLTTLYLRAHRPARKLALEPHAQHTPSKNRQRDAGNSSPTATKIGGTVNEAKKNRGARKFHHLVTWYLISRRNNLEEASLHASEVCKNERDIRLAIGQWGDWLEELIAKKELANRGKVYFFSSFLRM